MRRLLSRLFTSFLRVVGEHGAWLPVVPDPHGQFPGMPIAWYTGDDAPTDVVIPEQRAPSW